MTMVRRPTQNRPQKFHLNPEPRQFTPGDEFNYELVDSLGWGLKYQSAAKWTKPFVLSKSLVIRRLGKVPDEILAELQALIRTVFQ